jgi:Secretion system C-terminal sorting domain
LKKILYISILLFSALGLRADILLNETFTSGALPTGWTNTAIQGSDTWLFRSSPVFGSPSGGGYAVFDDQLLGAAVIPNESALTTIPVDFTNRTTAFLKITHHWFGVEFTYGYVEVSNDAGATWNTIQTYQKFTRGSIAAPQDTIFDITALAANQADVRVRFRYTDGSQAGRYWYLDDIVLYSNPDVGISTLVLPPYLNCAQTYGATETVTVEITNYSYEPVTNIPVTCAITGGATATLTGTYVGPPIPGGGTANFTFASTINMSPDDVYHFLSYTSLAGDSYIYNDTLLDGRQQYVQSYPYTADFNISNAGWFATGQNPPTNGGRSFEHGNIPYLNGPQGEGKSFYVEATGNAWDWIWVESPVFDFTSLTNPQLLMDIKHSLRNTNNQYYVQYSTNGGTTWTKLGLSSDPNWYNSSNVWTNSYLNPVNNWETRQHNLCMLAGQSCVKFRIYGRSYYGDNNTPAWYGFAFDNFVVQDGPDVSVIAYIDPVDVGCLFNANQDVTVRVFNSACNTVTNVPIQCDITGMVTTTLVGTVPGPIPVGGYVDYTFPTTFNMSAVGIYNFNTFTLMPGDINLSNDTLATSINVTNLKITTYPYLEDFNSGAGFWTASGQNPPTNGNRNFVLGALPYLNGPQGQGDSWYVQATGNAWDWIWVESPVFDFTNLTNAKLTFDIKHSLRNTNNQYYVNYSLDGGTTWTKLGTGTDPNWYNSSNVWTNSYLTPVDSWTQMEQELCQLSGEPCVKLRVYGRSYYGDVNTAGWYGFAFDNFAIDGGTPDDIQPIETILSDAGDCGSFGATETITVVIKNNTCRPLYNVPVDLQLNGGPIISEIMPGPIPRFGNYAYTFTATLDLSPVATHNISVTTNLATDSFAGNDNLIQTRINPPAITTFPYLADFNTNNDEWVSRTINESRLFRNDTLPYLNGQQGQGKSWYVEALGNAWDWIWVESPVFDFSALTNPQLFMDIKQSLRNTNNQYYVQYSTNGGTTWTKLGTGTDPNWYNSSNVWTNSYLNPVDNWETRQHSLCVLAGQSCVKFRVYGRSYYGDLNTDAWYAFAFDNVEIRDGPDVGVVTYIEPVDVGCLFGQTQQVTVTVYNWGCAPVSNIPIQCDITGALTTTLVGTVPGPIPAGGSVNYTFPTTFNMTNLGVYNFNTFTSMPGDIYPANDALATSVNVNILKVTTYPYFEDFNSGAGFWTASGQNPPTNGNRNFVLGALPYLNGPQGQGDSWYVQAVGNAWDWIWVESPVFDFTNLTNAKLTFDIKHSLRNTNNQYYVNYSLDGGTTWTKLGTGTDPNWYNSSNVWTNSYLTPVDSWTQMEQELCQLSGEPCVKLRIYGRSYYGDVNTAGWYGFAFDNFAIDGGTPDDIQPIETILSDAGDCASFGATETITVVIKNNTCRPLYNVPVDLQLNGGPIISEIMPGPIPRFGNYAYTFAATLDLSPAATHNISVTTNLATDSFAGNDNLIQTRINPPAITTFPYLADFNTNNDEWVSRTPNASRLFRNDTLPYLNGQQGQGKSWYVEALGNAWDWIWVESPVFDFSALTNPQLFMDIKHSLRNTNNQYYVQYSTNGGTTWTKLGTGTDPNWYNSSNVWTNSYLNPVDNWETRQHSLCVLAGQSCVKFRVYGRSYYGNLNTDAWYAFAFDNVEIRDGVDLGVTAYIEPAPSGCLYSTTQQVTVTVYNWGCTPVSNIPVQSDITGAVTTTLNGTVPGPIPGGGSVSYTFPTTFNMQGIGTYNFSTFTLAPGDFLPSNDTLSTSIAVTQPIVTTFPYYEDFNSGANFWIPTGNNPPVNGNRNFVLGALPYLNGPQGAGDSWYVEAVGNGWDWLWVESPVFDFTTLTNPQLSLDVKHSLRNTNNQYYVQYSLNGGTTWTKLGLSSDPNWYNSSNVWTNSYLTPVDSWTRMEHELCALAGQPCVKFRVYGRSYYGDVNTPNWYGFAFDNWHITDTPLDAALDIVVSCWGSQYQIDVTVQNNALPCTGTPIITDLDLTYIIDGSAPATTSYNSLNIAGGASSVLTIPNTTIPTSASTVQVWVTFPNGFNDQIFQNDTAYGVVANFPNCNDHCSNAIDLGLGTTTATQTSNATVDPLEDPNYLPCGAITVENTVWYQFTTNNSGDSVTIVFDNQVCSPSQNGIQISIDSVGTACDFTTYSNMYCSATNDTGLVQYGPVLLPPNTTYYIAIDGFAGSDCDFDITITGAVNPPLPIELLSFTANCGREERSVELKWMSSSEINNDYYSIERSDDATNFDVITQVKGAGNSNNVNSYYFKDNNVPNGELYYRLKQTDFNGNFEYFDIKAVDCSVVQTASIYPNPATGEFTVNVVGANDDVTIEMYNSIGQKVLEKVIKIENNIVNEQIAIDELREGIYFVNIKVGERVETQKLIIER